MKVIFILIILSIVGLARIAQAHLYEENIGTLYLSYEYLWLNKVFLYTILYNYHGEYLSKLT